MALSESEELELLELEEAEAAAANPDENKPFPDPNIPASEWGFKEPGLKDATVEDAMALQGVTGLAKAAIPGAIKNWTKAQLERQAQNQMLKSAGANVAQIRKLGPEKAREVAQYGLDKGLGDVFTTGMGRDKTLAKLTRETGKDIGKSRKAAGTSDKDILKEAETSLGKKYSDPLLEGQKGTLDKALASVKSMGENPSHADLSKKARMLNKFATKNQLTQPTGAVTDVANALSGANDAAIAAKLGPEGAAKYLASLDEFSKQRILKQFMDRGEAAETAGRGGLSLFNSLTSGIKDFAGHRMAAKGAQAASKALDGQGVLPSAVQLTPATVAEFLAKDEEEGFNQGGMVHDISDEIKAWVAKNAKA